MSRRKGLRVHLDVTLSQYIDISGNDGGDAAGYRDFLHKSLAERPDIVQGHLSELIDAAANTAWRRKPRDRGPDLFSIAGVTCPEYLTRPDAGSLAEGDEHGEGFRKVGQRHATVNDLADDAKIKARKAAEAGAAAAKRYQMADEARRRAKGNMATFLKDIADT